MTDRKPYAIITPYYKEDRATLERCLASVREQIVPVEHFVIADGHPQDWIDAEPVRHIRLDRSHGDFGNTPRVVGSILAIAEGCEGLGFLDADNWLERQHVFRCLEAARISRNCDYVVAQRNFYRVDGTLMDVEDIPVESHIDTNCFFLFPGSFHLVPNFSLMPHELSVIGDRVFYAAFRSANLNGLVVQEKTVNYRTFWPSDYLRAGETPPPEADRIADSKWITDWMNSKTPRELEVIYRRCGMRGRLNIVHHDEPPA